MKRIISALIVTATLATPVHAFVNPRTVSWWKETGEGTGKLHIEVVGGWWKCAGIVKVVDGTLPQQNVNMDCVGMAKSAVASITVDGAIRRKVNYRLSNGIKGHLTLL